MAEQLSTAQVLLLNNLMYMNNDGPFHSITQYGGKTVADIVNSIDINMIDDSYDYGSCITGNEWKDMLTAIRNDPQLMQCQVNTTHVDAIDNGIGGGGGTSALFTDPSTNDAIVVFRGTASQEWKDDFIGGAATGTADGVSTPQQENALNWYKSLDLDGYNSVTVTGHSKGGNKAKYITVMDGDVDRCLSFDGQGFSDEFMVKYKDRISAVQDRIQNHNAQSDYVNLLLNDIGDSTFYKGNNYGAGGFLENHCPNAMFSFDDNGNPVMTVAPRDSDMAALDDFLNSMIRSMPSEDRQKVLSLVGEIVEANFNDTEAGDLLDMLLSTDDPQLVSYVLAYVLKYEREDPEMMEHIKSALKTMGFEEYLNYVDTVDSWLDKKMLVPLISAGSNFILDLDDKYLDKLCNFIKKKFGLDLSREQMRQLLLMLSLVNDDMKDIEIDTEGGHDIRYPSTSSEAIGSSGKTGSGSGQPCGFTVTPDILASQSEAFNRIMLSLGSCMSELNNSSNSMKGSLKCMKTPLTRINNSLHTNLDSCDSMREALSEISKLYSSTEKAISGT